MAEKRKIYFRADAGPEIGYGHYIRSLALADMLKHDFDCTMFTQSPTDYQLHEAEPICPVVALPADNSKFGLFLDQLQGDEIVVLDNYFYDTDYQRLIKRKGCRLICIDDMHDKHFVADAIINSAPNIESSHYDIEPYTQLYLGLDYMMLRREFREATLSKQHFERGKDVFVCFGGSDEHDFTQRTCRILLENTDYHVNVVVGGAYQYRQSLEALDKQRVNVYSNLQAHEMVRLMQQSYFAIVPLSTTFLETCCTRTPIISGYDADNQLGMAQSAIINSMCYNCGDLFDNFKPNLLTGIVVMNSCRRVDIIEAQNRNVHDSTQNLKQIFLSL